MSKKIIGTEIKSSAEMVSPTVFRNKYEIKGFKIVECYGWLDGSMYRALSDIIIPADSTVVWPLGSENDDSSMRSNHLKMIKLHKKHRFDKCFSWLKGRLHKYEDDTEYSEPELDLRVGRTCEKGLHFSTDRNQIIKNWTSAANKVNQIEKLSDDIDTSS
jgi:hypothetical protein